MYNAYIKDMKKSIFLIFLMGLLSLLYTGCGNSNSHTKEDISYEQNISEDISYKQNISGIIQKGNFINGTLTAQRVNIDGSTFGKVVRVSIDKDAKYKLSLSWKGLTLLSAKGKFFNEYTGKNSTEDAQLYALVNSSDSLSKEININLFTSLETYRVIELMKEGKSYKNAISLAKSSLKALVGLSEKINATKLNIYDIKSTLKEENKNLLLFSGTLLKILDTNSTQNSSQQKLIQKFSLSKMENFLEDFGDNGKIDGVAKGIYQDMRQDDEVNTWDRIINRLGLTGTKLDNSHHWYNNTSNTNPINSHVGDVGNVGTVDNSHNYDDIVGDTRTDFRITEFSLHSVSLKGHPQNYNHESISYIGLPSDEVKFNFLIKDNSAQAYTFTIYAKAGTHSKVVKENISVALNEDSKLVEVEVDSSLKEFLRNAYSSGDNVKFMAVSNILLNNITFVSKTSDVMPKFVGLSETLTINNKNLNITSATYLYEKSASSCQSLSNGLIDSTDTIYAKFNINVEWQPSENWSVANGGFSHGCVELTYNDTTKSFDVIPKNNIRFSGNSSNSTSFTAEGYTLELNLDEMRISPNGLVYNAFYGDTSIFKLSLPKDVTFHLGVEDNRTSPVSYSVLPYEIPQFNLFYIKNINISSNWDEISLTSVLSQEKNLDAWFHVKELPFYIEMDDTILFNSDGIHLTNISARYIHTGAIDINNMVSNDILFSNPTGTFNATINEDGLQTQTPIHFDAVTDAKTHFPYATMTQGGFDVNIVNGEMTPVNVEGEGSYKFAYSSECQGTSCSDEGSPSTVEHTLASTTRYISQDGAFMSGVEMSGKKIAWGSKKGNKNVFERDADTKGVMYVPGFSIHTNNADELVKQLMGSRDITDGKLSSSNPLGSDESNKGNGLFAGLNVGSLYLDSANPDPLTSLTNTNMNIQVGGVSKTSLTLNSNAKTKYYIRPSGITGVFNGSLQQANEELSIYGYPMTFKHFAFSQVANKLDTKTLIDGKISVIGDGGFGVDFSSLALDCTGALNGGLVDESDCEASPTINCEQTLAKWKTKTQFVSVDFETGDTGVCADKTLKIGHVLDVRALTNPLGLTTNWTTAGKPEHSIISGSSSNFLDRNENDAESKGFAITLDSGSELTDGGWYKFSGAFGLPFWGMQNVDLGLTNNSNTLKRNKTRVMPRNALNQTTYTDNKEQKFMASYQWGSTGFGFELPVVYEAKDSSKESEFIGKKLEIDLGVMDAQAGINYIKPSKTKISFGASADFEAMGKLQIKIDLNDPESIKKIDDTLDTFGIGGDPIYNTIGLVLDPLHKAEEYADKGLLLGMEELGVLALKKGTDEVGLDPFEEVSNSLVKIHTLPIQAIDMTEDYITEELDNKLAMALSPIQDLVKDVGNDVNAKTADEIKTIKQNAINALDTVLNNFSVLERLDNQLKDIDTLLSAINIEAKWNRLDDNISTILGNRGASKEECSAFLLNDSELFKPISTLKNNINSVNHKLQNIDIATVKSFASKVEKKIDFDTSNLVNAFEKTQTTANSLTGEIATAQNKIDGYLQTFCGEANTIRDDIKNLILKINKFNNIRTQLQNYVGIVRNNLKSENLKQIKIKIENLKIAISNSTFTVGMSDGFENNLTNIASGYILSSIENITVDNISISSLKSDLKKSLKKIPQPTADELRHMVVTKILDTEAMKDIRVSMNDAFSPAMDEVREVVVELFSSVNQVIYDVFDKLSKKANEALASATSAVNSLPIKSGKMDGYALISGDELDRLHIGAEWEVDSGDKDTSYSFNGALDMQRWGAGGKAGCGGGTSTDGNMDVKISTRDIKLNLGSKKLSVDELYFGFTLAKAIPVGIMGGIESKLGFEFNKFSLFDMKLLVGIGAIETYLGAKSSAIFDVYQMNVAFLLGKTCGKEIITSLDPEVAKFITLPNNVFKGAYIRGGASFPIWDNGCALTVGVTADLGAWVLIPGTYGGLVGGGAYGKALCIAALKGEVQTKFQKSGDNLKFQGEGWGAAGVGWCSPSKWYSVAKSRRDSWCGTGDAQFGAKYDNGWELLDISTSAVY